MYDASTFGFATRPEGIGILFVRNPEKALPKLRLENGMSVILIRNDQRVLLRSVRANPDGTFVGKIYGFEPRFALEFDGMQLEESVVFLDSHVFSASD